MTLDIPDNVQFLCDAIKVEDECNRSRAQRLCFRHAVVQALAGQNIKTVLIDDWTRCDECDKEKA